MTDSDFEKWLCSPDRIGRSVFSRALWECATRPNTSPVIETRTVEDAETGSTVTVTVHADNTYTIVEETLRVRCQRCGHAFAEGPTSRDHDRFARRDRGGCT